MLKLSLMLRIFFVISCSVLIYSTYALEKGLYQIVSDDSTVGFAVKNFGFFTVNGTFEELSGSINISDSFERSSVQAEVDVKSVNTSIEGRDRHLLEPDFFDVDKYPKMIFKSISIDGSMEKFTISGNLTIRNVTKQVSLNCKVNKLDVKVENKVNFECETQVNRKDYGVSYSPMIGDNVKIKLDIMALRQR